jgi:hypothetical protein
MASATLSTRSLRAVSLLLVVVGVLAALGALFLRVKAEYSSRAVDLVVDYNEVMGLYGTLPSTGTMARLPNSTFIALRDAGATAVALQEETLKTLQDQGMINIVARPSTAGSFPGSWSPNDPVFTVDATNSDPDVLFFIHERLSQVYPEANLAFFPPFRILVRGNRDVVSDLGLGLYPRKVDFLKAVGMRIVPRLHGSPALSLEGLRTTLQGVAQELPAPDTKQAAVVPGMTLRERTRVKGDTGPALTAPMRGVVIFDGDMIPGYKTFIPELAREMVHNGLVYGAVEFAKQKGDALLGQRLGGDLVRVHSISVEELSTLTQAEAVQRFGLAAKDRNIRVLYVHLPPLAGADRQADAAGYLAAIKAELQLPQNGFTVSAAKPAHPFGHLALPPVLLILVFLGAAGGFFLWLLAILPATLPKSWVVVGWVLVVLGTLKSVALALVMPSLGRMGFGLFAAIFFPLLALTYAYRILERLHATCPARPLGTAVGALLAATGITLLGGLLIAAMFADARYLVKIGQFVGVKAALAMPLLLFALLVVTDGIAHAGETLADYGARLKRQFVAFLGQPLYLWGMIAAAAALVVVALMLARSGNDAGVGVSDLELKVRSLLEQVFIARPRTKEFLIGHPLFLFSLVAAARGNRGLAALLLVGAAIGQVDVLNTFCHAHTPVLLSLLRVINGLWLGIAVGVIALAIFYRPGLKPAKVTTAVQ